MATYIIDSYHCQPVRLRSASDYFLRRNDPTKLESSKFAECFNDLGSLETKNGTNYRVCHMPSCVEESITKAKNDPSSAKIRMTKTGPFGKRYKDEVKN